MQEEAVLAGVLEHWVLRGLAIVGRGRAGVTITVKLQQQRIKSHQAYLHARRSSSGTALKPILGLSSMSLQASLHHLISYCCFSPSAQRTPACLLRLEGSQCHALQHTLETGRVHEFAGDLLSVLSVFSVSCKQEVYALLLTARPGSEAPPAVALLKKAEAFVAQVTGPSSASFAVSCLYEAFVASPAVLSSSVFGLEEQTLSAGEERAREGATERAEQVSAGRGPAR